MTTLIRFSRTWLGVLAPALIAVAANAQSGTNDPRWEAWLGCWQAAATVDIPSQATARVCVTPTAGGVAIATINDSRVVARDTIIADGARHAVDARGCKGWRSAEWSRDSRRVYLHSEFACGPALTRTSSGVIAMAERGQWLDIHGARAGGGSSVQDVRYIIADASSLDIPAEFAEMARARDLTPDAMMARKLAGASIGTQDVIDASKHVDADVVEAWLVERGQNIDVDAHALVSLANAGVPGSVTDVLIGLAYPDRFVLRQAQTSTANGAPRPTLGQRYGYADCDSFDPTWYSQYSFDPCYSRYGSYAYGYRPYGYTYGNGYGLDPVVIGGYITPVVVTPRKPEPPHGVAVKGRGYTRPADRSAANVDASDQGSARVSHNPSSGSGSGGSSGSSPPQSSGSGSSGSSSSGRTAQSRPPDPPKPVKPPPAP